MKVRIVITPPVLLATMLALAAWLPLLAAPQALTRGPTPKSSLSPGRGADPRTAPGVPQTIYLRSGAQGLDLGLGMATRVRLGGRHVADRFE